MFITVQIKHYAYVTRTIILPLYVDAININALFLSMHERINTLLKECSIKRQEPLLQLFNNSILCVELFFDEVLLRIRTEGTKSKLCNGGNKIPQLFQLMHRNFIFSQLLCETNEMTLTDIPTYLGQFSLTIDFRR